MPALDTRRARWLALAASMTLLMTSACSADSSPSDLVQETDRASTSSSTAPPRTGSKPLDDSFETKYREVTPDPTPRSSIPLTIGAVDVDLKAVLNTAKDAHTAAGGAAAARDMAKLLTDARGTVSGERILEAIAAPSLPPKIRTYLATDLNAQNASGSGRYFDLTAGGYYRMSSTGDPAAPDRVSFELAAVLASDRHSFRRWYRLRYDVIWIAEKGWRLVDYSDGKYAPSGDKLSATERASFLTGPGWHPLSDE